MSQSIEEKVEFAQNVLTKLVSDNQAKLKRGMELRAQMHTAIQAGEIPTGYRVKWLRQSSARVIKFLEELATEFNKTYPDDRASALDLQDVLATALGLLRRAAKGG